MKKTLMMAILMQGFAFNAMAQDAKLEFSGNCVYPEKPAGVDGSTATEPQMISFNKEMKEYLAKGNDFLACLDKEEGLMDPGASSEQQKEFKDRITQTYNLVVDEMNAIADSFNTALRAFKAQKQ